MMMATEELGQRVARLEERVDTIHAVLTEIRNEQREISNTLAHASGGLRVMKLLGASAAAFGFLNSLAHWARAWLSDHFG